MSTKIVIGVDPGVTTGIALLEYQDNKLVGTDSAQVSPNITALVMGSLLDRFTHADVTVAIEQFVVRRRAAKTSSAAAGAITRSIIGLVEAQAELRKARVVKRSASEVKPWATNQRLAKAEIESVGTHARDAARHALFAAVNDLHLPDPLSKYFPQPIGEIT